MKIIKIKNYLWGLIFLMLLLLQFQNCAQNNQMRFFAIRQSLKSSLTGGGSFDGKPEQGYYCRVTEGFECKARVSNLQSLAYVDNSLINLTVDNCAESSFNFPATSDPAVTFTSLMPDYLGISRGIFKKCEVDSSSEPLPSNEMTDVFCTSEDGNAALVINKNIQTKAFDFKFVFRDGNSLRSTAGAEITKTLNPNSTVYVSQTEVFNLTISQSNAQTMQGQLETVVDDKIWNSTLNCRQSSLQPTILVQDDMELSSTWIDTAQLVGYWKLNEPNLAEGSIVMDSSRYGSSGVLLTGSDGLNKNDVSAKGGAISLDSTNDSVRVLKPRDGHHDFGTRSFSYMMWVKKTIVTGRFDMPLHYGGGTADSAGFDIECGAYCTANISDGAGVVGLSARRAMFFSDTTPYLGQWVLLVAVVDRSTQQLRAYVNGKLAYTNLDISTVGSVNGTRELRLGGTDLGVHPFGGSIDDVALWNRALSDSEILEIYQRLRPKFN